MFKKLLDKLIRPTLVLVTGALVHKGYVDSETASTTVDAVLSFGEAVLSSAAYVLISKYSDKKL